MQREGASALSEGVRPFCRIPDIECLAAETFFQRISENADTFVV